jgi:hypothetical protein
MPFCPNCRDEYRPGILNCADCHAALVDALPEQYEPPSHLINDVPIARADSVAIAQMWAELLDADGIACRLLPAGAGDTMLVPGQARWEVRVAAIDAARAMELLEAGEVVAGEDDVGAEFEDDLDESEAEDAPAGGSGVRWLIVGIAVVAAALLLFAGAQWFS